MATAKTSTIDTGTNAHWQCNPSVLERNKYMFEQKLATDVVFIVGSAEKERVEAHKYMLISGSSVFWSMFCGNLQEKGEVEVTDINPKIFKEMLRFIYFEKVHVKGATVYQLLYAADKYYIPALTKACTDYLESILCIDHVCLILDYSLLFELQALKHKCMQLIRQKTADVIATESYRNMRHESLLMITSDEMLSIDETDLLLSCIDWAYKNLVQKSNQATIFSGNRIRDELGDVLFQIRFTLINTKDFGNLVVKTGILTKDEEILCYRYNSQNKKPTNFPFPTKPRNGMCTAALGLTNKQLPLFDSCLNSKSTVHLQIKNSSEKSFVVVGFKAYVVPQIILYYVHTNEQDLEPTYKCQLLRFFRIQRNNDNSRGAMYSDNIIESVRHQPEDGTKLVLIKPFVVKSNELLSMCAMYFHAESRLLAYRTKFAPFTYKKHYSAWVSIVSGNENPFTEICVKPLK